MSICASAFSVILRCSDTSSKSAWITWELLTSLLLLPTSITLPEPLTTTGLAPAEGIAAAFCPFILVVVAAISLYHFKALVYLVRLLAKGSAEERETVLQLYLGVAVHRRAALAVEAGSIHIDLDFV